MNKKTYDNLKIISLIIPIIITATIELQHIFGFTPIIAEVMGVVETALISILKISSDKYFSDKDIVDKIEG